MKTKVKLWNLPVVPPFPIIRLQTLSVLSVLLIILLFIYVIAVKHEPIQFENIAHYFQIEKITEIIGWNKEKEGMTDKLYGNTSLIDSTTAINDVLTSHNSSTVKTLNIKNILLDTKIGSQENLSATDKTFYDNYQNMLNILNDNTISTDKQLVEIKDIMKTVSPPVGGFS